MTTRRYTRTRSFRASIAYYDALAATLRSQPAQWAVVPAEEIGGPNRKRKQTILTAAMQERGLGIATCANADGTTLYARITRDAGVPPSLYSFALIERPDAKRIFTPLYDSIAATLQAEPDVWHRYALADLPGTDREDTRKRLAVPLYHRGVFATARTDENFLYLKFRSEPLRKHTKKATTGPLSRETENSDTK